MRPGGRWLALALAVIAGVVVGAVLIGPRLGGTSGSPSALPSASAASDGSSTPLPSEISSPTPLPSQISLPIPSWDPGVGTLVLRLWLESTDPFHVLTLLEDGHVIYVSFAPGPNQGSTVDRRLTPAGVQLVRDELDATGLTFSNSVDYYPDGPVDGYPFTLEVALAGGGAAVINWRSGAIGPEVDLLDALQARLSTLEEWLPASAWADANARPYAAAQYRIHIFAALWSGGVNDLPVESSTVSWPMINGIDAFGDVMDIATQEGDANGSGPQHCRVVGVEEATAVIEALEAAGATREVPNAIPGYFSLGARAAGRVVYISFEPVLPLADTSCGSEVTF